MVSGALLIVHSFLLQAAPQEVAIRSHAYVPPSSILRAETNLVEASLCVRDSRGNTIGGLHASDFQVLDNGVPQKITAFSEVRADGKRAENAPAGIPAAEIPPEAPKFVTFFFDDFHMNNASIQFAVKGAHAFIAKGLKPSDRMSIVTASGQGDFDFTSDAEAFAEKLNHLASHTRPATVGGCGSVGPNESYIIVHNLDVKTKEGAVDQARSCACGDAEKESVCHAKASAAVDMAAEMSWDQTQALSVETFDALTFAAKRLSESNGTRILVLTSSGFLVRPVQPEMERFIDEAVRWNVVIHAIDAGGLVAQGGDARLAGLRQSNGWLPLLKLTEGTGGHFFRNNNDLAAAMNLAANPEVTYLLAFNPGPHDGKFHTLKIRFLTKRPESVQFRPGYFSPPDQTKEILHRAAMDGAVFSGMTLTDFPAAVSLAPSPGGVTVTVVVDVKQLQFVTGGDRHGQQIVFLMTLLDSHGAFVTGKEAIMDLALSDAHLATLEKSGLKAVATLSVPAGNYQARTIVREGMKGRLAASTAPVAIPPK